MLILTRKPGQAVFITPNKKILDRPIRELFEHGHMTLKVTGIQGNQVKIGIQAHRDLVILREELELREMEEELVVILKSRMAC